LIHFVDVEKKLRLSLLTNQFLAPALTMAHLYKARWQVELFF
jgi:IS4 transposase